MCVPKYEYTWKLGGRQPGNSAETFSASKFAVLLKHLQFCLNICSSDETISAETCSAETFAFLLLNIQMFQQKSAETISAVTISAETIGVWPAQPLGILNV
jgi:hypothetical protein